ncbi:MAG TPA: hypothetical protein VNS32_22755 [Flavisolibacter sp.]|nr:hypothetical protein [Flavisolibacter sp.]
MEYNLIYFIGIFLSFCVGFAGLVISIRNTRRTGYINSITSARIKYIQDIRNAVSEFCGLINTYNSEHMYRLMIRGEKEEELASKKELFEMRKKSDYLKYLIRLHLNIEDVDFDKTIIDLLDEIIELRDSNPKPKINELIIIMQYLLKLEWEGAKLESRKGIISKKLKDRLYRKYAKLYKKYQIKSKETHE